MSEKIGNALTDEKNTVQLVTADTVITSGGESANSAVFSGVLSASNSGMLVFYNGQFYQIARTTSADFQIKISKVAFPS